MWKIQHRRRPTATPGASQPQGSRAIPGRRPSFRDEAGQAADGRGEEVREPGVGRGLAAGPIGVITRTSPPSVRPKRRPSTIVENLAAKSLVSCRPRPANQ